jgi:hypothetical protein
MLAAAWPCCQSSSTLAGNGQIVIAKSEATCGSGPRPCEAIPRTVYMVRGIASLRSQRHHPVARHWLSHQPEHVPGRFDCGQRRWGGHCAFSGIIPFGRERAGACCHGAGWR